MELTPLMVLISLILPAIMGLITRLIKDSDARFWASVLICTITGIILNLIESNLVYPGMSVSQIVNSFAGSAIDMIGLAQLTYAAIWNNKSISKLLPDEIIEDNISPLKQMGLKNNSS